MIRNIAVFASGSGTNAENIIRCFERSRLARVALVVTNKSNAYVLQRAADLGVPSRIYPKADWETGAAVLVALREFGIDFIVLAGFLVRVPDAILEAYPRRIVNIHPSLLPKYGGRGMYGMRVHQAVLEAGEKETGITIHYIDDRYDEGDVIFQAVCPVLGTDTPDDVAARVHRLEYKHYPEVIAQLVASLGEATSSCAAG